MSYWLLELPFLLFALGWLEAWCWALIDLCRRDGRLFAATGYSLGLSAAMLFLVPPLGILLYGFVVRPTVVQAGYKRSAWRQSQETSNRPAPVLGQTA